MEEDSPFSRHLGDVRKDPPLIEASVEELWDRTSDASVNRSLSARLASEHSPLPDPILLSRARSRSLPPTVRFLPGERKRQGIYSIEEWNKRRRACAVEYAGCRIRPDKTEPTICFQNGYGPWTDVGSGFSRYYLMYFLGGVVSRVLSGEGPR